MSHEALLDSSESMVRRVRRSYNFEDVAHEAN